MKIAVYSYLTYLFAAFILSTQMSCAQSDSIEKPALLKEKSEIILNRKGYTVSYNKENKIPNWVAWHLTSDHADGVYRRTGGYQEDTEVPKPRATKEDYDTTRWSHGHMCPAADNKWDKKAMIESNLLTNICPQDRSLNSGLWNGIERNCRKWAKEYGDLYIVCGPVLLNREHETIGENKIVVPEAFFKVVLCADSTNCKGIGFICRNTDGNRKKDLYVNSIRQVERITGYRFFPLIEDSLRTQVYDMDDINYW